jgi:ABC-type amino acid transport substrate-binding protein
MGTWAGADPITILAEDPAVPWGRIDLAVVNVDELKNPKLVLSTPGAGAGVVLLFSLGTQGTYLGFAADRPETPGLVAAFDRGMGLIEKNGTRAQILETWRQRR